jgi:hypothetical protein
LPSSPFACFPIRRRPDGEVVDLRDAPGLLRLGKARRPATVPATAGMLCSGW